MVTECVTITELANLSPHVKAVRAAFRHSIQEINDNLRAAAREGKYSIFYRISAPHNVANPVAKRLQQFYEKQGYKTSAGRCEDCGIWVTWTDPEA